MKECLINSIGLMNWKMPYAIVFIKRFHLKLIWPIDFNDVTFTDINTIIEWEHIFSFNFSWSKIKKKCFLLLSMVSSYVVLICLISKEIHSKSLKRWIKSTQLIRPNFELMPNGEYSNIEIRKFRRYIWHIDFHARFSLLFTNSFLFFLIYLFIFLMKRSTTTVI